jgi:hypothetical protein
MIKDEFIETPPFIDPLSIFIEKCVFQHGFFKRRAKVRFLFGLAKYFKKKYLGGAFLRIET